MLRFKVKRSIYILDFDSLECKSVIHKIIQYLFSIIDELEPYVQPEKLVKYSTSVTINDSTATVATTPATKVTCMVK